MSISFGLSNKSLKNKLSNSKPAPKLRSALAPESDEEDEAEQKPKTLDEEALDALLGRTTKKYQVLIESASNERFKARVTDVHAFKSDANSRPDESSLGNYGEVPIEGFGTALLNGMGWKNGTGDDKLKGATSKARNKIRPTSLGIGASVAPDGVEIGAWGKGDKKSNRIDRSVNYSKRKNPKTGEIVTEDEYQKSRQNQTLVTGESRSRPRSMERGAERSERDSHKSSRRRENGDSASRSQRHDSDNSRHRSRSPDSHRRRHRDKPSESEMRPRQDRDRSWDRHRDSQRHREERRHDRRDHKQTYSRHERYDKEEKRRRHRDRDDGAMN